MINKIELSTNQAKIIVEALKLLRLQYSAHTLDVTVPQHCEYLIKIFNRVFQLSEEGDTNG